MLPFDDVIMNIEQTNLQEMETTFSGHRKSIICLKSNMRVCVLGLENRRFEGSVSLLTQKTLNARCFACKQDNDVQCID